MLRVTSNNSAEGASRYYDEGLSRQDYYAEKGEIIGNWGGKAAEKLGLSGEVNKDGFVSLCYNVNPETSEQLTARNVENRTVGYDFTFSVPKSVSIAYGITQDEKILDSFRSAVSETMKHVEEEAATRVRKNGLDENRQTGNLAWAEFIHTTSRPIDGVPDCHLHAHCFTFNATYDEQESQWKAAQFRQLKTDAPYYEAHFNSLLADKLQKSGYDLERTKVNFELAGISRDTIDKFSNRTQEIEKLAVEKGITNAKTLDGLGSKTREHKRKGLSPDELRGIWADRLTPAESEKIFSAFGGKEAAVEKKKEPTKEVVQKLTPDECIDHALSHSLERKSAVEEKKLLTEAYKRGFTSCSPEEIQKAYQNRTDLIRGKMDSGQFITTKAAIQEENQLVKSCITSKGKFKALNDNYQYKNESLNFEQRKAISHTLNSTDGIIAIEGGAGTGKTTLMSEVRTGIEESGRKIFAFAPSSQASRGVLRGEGYEQADTLASLLINKQLQEQTKGHVLWVDEAGMVGNKTMNQLMELATANNNRIILTGDTKQHASVERGDAFRNIQDKGGIKAIRVNEVVRQKNALSYKAAMEHISKGAFEKGYDELDKSGSIREIQDKDQRLKEMAAEYLQGISERKGKGFKDVLVVAPTHKEGEMVTDQIRETLRGAGKIGKEDQQLTRLKNLNLTEAERQDTINYQAGHVVEFNQNVKGFKAGEKLHVTGKDEKGNILVRNGNTEMALPASEAGKFQVYAEQPASFATGDKIRITKNGKATNGTKLNNGQIYNITGFDKTGNIQISNGTTLNKDFGHITHGYAVTSNSSQGKTVDKVIVAQSSYSFGASTQEQFYVSVSRGKEAVSVYTDNKQDLQNVVCNRSSERISAQAVADQAQAGEKKIQNQSVLVNRLQALKDSYATWQNKAVTVSRNAVNRIVSNAAKYASPTPSTSFTQSQKPVITQSNGTQRTTPKR